MGQDATSISCTHSSPHRYEISVMAAEPYTLVMSNSYHPLWRALVGGSEYEPYPSYYGATAFDIEDTGEQTVVIEFVGQKAQVAGLWISGLTWIGCIAWLSKSWARRLLRAPGRIRGGLAAMRRKLARHMRGK